MARNYPTSLIFGILVFGSCMIGLVLAMLFGFDPIIKILQIVAIVLVVAIGIVFAVTHKSKTEA